MKSLLKRVARALLPRNSYEDLLASLTVEERKLVTRIRERNLTYLPTKKLKRLIDICKEIESKEIEGAFIEAGCALGGSAILISKVKDDSRPLRIYDVFGMIPPPSEDDPQDVHDRYQTIVDGKSQGIGGDEYYGYIVNLYEVVQENLREFDCDCSRQSITLVKGLVQDTLQLDGPIAFAHVDVDWYEPVKTCLERIWPCLSVGGSIILDDYHDWGGCRKATDEFLMSHAGQYTKDDSAGSMLIQRIT